MITQFDYTCQNPSCGKHFKSRGKNRKYCCKQCKYDTMIGQPQHPNSGKKKTKKPTRSICEYCEQPFERKVVPSSKNQFRFCSPACRNKARITPDIQCPVCDNPFKPTVNRKKFCSQACAAIGRRGTPSLKATPQRIKDDVIKLYPKFGPKPIMKKYSLSIAAVRAIAHKAGVKLDKDTLVRSYDIARQRMINNNPMKIESVKKQRRDFYKANPDKKERMVAKLFEGHRQLEKSKPSKLELRLFSYLDEIGIVYDSHYLVKPKFIVDVRIGNLIIQADGDYWHGHPRFKNLTERQLKQQARDKAQDKYLTACGYKVVRIWESDMCKDLVIKALRDNGLL